MDIFESLGFLVILWIIGVGLIKVLIDVVFVDKLQQIVLDKNSGIRIWGICFAIIFFTGVLGMIASALMVSAIPYTEDDSNEAEIKSEED